VLHLHPRKTRPWEHPTMAKQIPTAEQGILPWLLRTDGTGSSVIHSSPIASGTNTACTSSHTYQGGETVPSSQRGDMSFPSGKSRIPSGTQAMAPAAEVTQAATKGLDWS